MPGDDDYRNAIMFATACLRGGNVPKAVEKIAELKCLLIDEIQDLVGPRADFVLEVAARVRANGNTVCVLGDPAQAINDYQVKSGGTTTEAFLEKMREILGESRRAYSFSKPYRYNTQKMKDFVSELRTSMGRDGVNPDMPRLSEAVSEVQTKALASLVQFRDQVKRDNKTAAILTRRNLQAWEVVDYCRRNEIDDSDVTLQGGAGGGWPSWLARVFARWNQEFMRKDRFRDKWNEQVGDLCGLTWAEAWARAELAEVCDGNTGVDLIELRRRVKHQGAPRNDSESVLTVSTIHKSKGLEFDRVLLLEPDRNLTRDEARILYVAATRGRETLELLEKPAGFRKSRIKLKHDYDNSKGKWRLLLVNGKELDKRSLVMPDGYSTLEMQKIQDVLWGYVQGKTYAQRFEVSRTGNGGYALQIPAEGDRPTVAVCKMKEGLSEDLQELQKYQSGGVTRGNCEVSELETVAFDERDEEATKQFGRAGLALAPVLEGYLEVKSG